ncbi:MAG: hypothetical protein AAF384_18245 [Pseudomonadota bacterium]
MRNMLDTILPRVFWLTLMLGLSHGTGATEEPTQLPVSKVSSASRGDSLEEFLRREQELSARFRRATSSDERDQIDHQLRAVRVRIKAAEVAQRAREAALRELESNASAQ